MSDYVGRMKVEHKELEEKISKLKLFIFSNEKYKELTDIDKAQMIKQLGFMESYRDVLGLRIWVC